MKDQIDVAVRRSPKYSVFMGLGAIVGVLVAGVLTLFVDPEAMPTGYTVAKGAGLLLLILAVGGLFLGGLLAVILDRVWRRKTRSYRVDAEIDMVDDPKETARRRIAEANGEDPEAEPAGSTGPGTLAEADGSADATPTATSAADGIADDESRNGSSSSGV
ncbi:hypothetical protein [Brevibacterium marinum]|uniref:Uncharacterized protein n=1 Tax=Brevibacterium marinum TaxID=418643 RepID=A0A846S4V8_9MICO|nr:hypothetical protein [Brevibacterium marinum]NJC58660.1 hypothetical protein [Brevibacterium marinum]